MSTTNTTININDIPSEWLICIYCHHACGKTCLMYICRHCNYLKQPPIWVCPRCNNKLAQPS